MSTFANWVKTFKPCFYANTNELDDYKKEIKDEKKIKDKEEYIKTQNEDKYKLFEEILIDWNSNKRAQMEFNLKEILKSPANYIFIMNYLGESQDFKVLRSKLKKFCCLVSHDKHPEFTQQECESSKKWMKLATSLLELFNIVIIYKKEILPSTDNLKSVNESKKSVEKPNRRHKGDDRKVLRTEIKKMMESLSNKAAKHAVDEDFSKYRDYMEMADRSSTTVYNYITKLEYFVGYNISTNVINAIQRYAEQNSLNLTSAWIVALRSYLKFKRGVEQQAYSKSTRSKKID